MVRRSRAVVLATVVLLLAVRAEARRRKRHNTSAMLARHRMALYWRLLRYVFVAMVAPALVAFAYSLARDPAVPQIARELAARLKRRLADGLSSSSPGRSNAASAKVYVKPRGHRGD